MHFATDALIESAITSQPLHAGCESRIMSDVQVVNHTMLRLNIGERTSLNRDVKIIHTLAPHESFCLSACRSEPGLICFQPAGKL